MNDIFKRLEELCTKLSNYGYDISNYAMQDIKNKRTDREIILLSIKNIQVQFKNNELQLYTISSNIKIDYDFMVELNYLNDVKNDFNEGKNIK